MPYKFETQHLKKRPEDNKRIKLTDDDKKEIVKLYATGMFSQRKLAEMFNVHRRSIQFVLNPEALKRNQEQRKERGKDGRYYDKEKHKEYMREYRHQKKKLCDEGKLV